MESCLSKGKALGHLLICMLFLAISSSSSDAATKTYTLTINTAASTVYWSGGIAGSSGQMSIEGTFEAVVTDGVIEFRNVKLQPSDPLTAQIIPGYPGTATPISSGYSFSGSKAYSNSTGGGNFSGDISGAGFSLIGSFQAPCCDMYNYEFFLLGTAVLDGCSTNADCMDPLFYCAKAPSDCLGKGICQPRPANCITLYAPVCGCDGLTYGNACEAAKAGVSVAYQGICVAPGCGCLPGECPAGTECIGAETLCLASCTCPMCTVCAGICCGDNNLCTIDSAAPGTGCVYTPRDCNDNNVCTIDSCNPSTGCVHTPIDNCDVNTTNNFTMLDPDNNLVGGANDVTFAWDGTLKTSVAVSGQVSNATISSPCTFFGVPWKAHDVTIYGPGSYTIYTDCPAGSPGCGSITLSPVINPVINFTVKEGEIGIHMLFDWNISKNIDVVNVMTPNAVFPNLWTGACGSNDACTVWRWASKDIDGDGVPGIGMVDGPFQGMNANFNLNKVTVDPCCDAAVRCDDGNACTDDSCAPVDGECIHLPTPPPDPTPCMIYACDPATGIIYTPVNCDDNNACTIDSCDPATGCVHTVINCDDNNKCTVDTCDPATGCHNNPMACDDGNKCTIDTCDPGTGCVYQPKCPIIWDPCSLDINPCDPATGECRYPPPIVCDDHNACTIDRCDPLIGCVFTPINADDHNACTIDTCDPITGVHHTPIVCDDGSKCTIDTCDPTTGCVFTPIICNDGDACTIDSCDPVTGCKYPPRICNDSNACTIDSCDPATGACVFTPVPNGTSCPGGCGTCQNGTCVAGYVCPPYAKKTITLRGSGQNWWMENQIQTSFSVAGCGCILAYTDNSVTASPNTVLSVNWRVGTGPHPASAKWKPAGGSAQTLDPKKLWMLTCPATTGNVGTLTLNNTSAHGKDSDTLTVKTALQ